MWLASLGNRVRFRNPYEHSNTSDVLVDGVNCDFKKIESKSLKKMSRRLTEKLDRQGPAFLVDLSQSDISREEAEARLSRLLDDERISMFYLVKGGKIEIVKK